jgi:hypothetical protein
MGARNNILRTSCGVVYREESSCYGWRRLLETTESPKSGVEHTQRGPVEVTSGVLVQSLLESIDEGQLRALRWAVPEM